VKKFFKMFNRLRTLFLGSPLDNSLLKLTNELSQNLYKRETISEVITHIIWRLTIIGIFTIIISIIPISLLLIQTILLKQQNSKLESQNNLIQVQNKTLKDQSKLFEKQNTLIDYQNLKISNQLNLQEAERRSSLVFLFNNVLDKLDDELKNNTKRNLSSQLKARIISLSRALKPYKYLEGDSIINKLISPERGQLLISLIESNLSKKTYEDIFAKGDFSYADLSKTTIKNAHLNFINLSYAYINDNALSG